jgi:hypothetical protein
VTVRPLEQKPRSYNEEEKPREPKKDSGSSLTGELATAGSS